MNKYLWKYNFNSENKKSFMTWITQSHERQLDKKRGNFIPPMRWEYKYHIVWVPDTGGKYFTIRFGKRWEKFFLVLLDKKQLDFGKTFLFRPHSYVDVDFTEIFCGPSGGSIWRERVPFISFRFTWVRKGWQRNAFLGTRILCVERLSEWRGHPKPEIRKTRRLMN